MKMAPGMKSDGNGGYHIPKKIDYYKILVVVGLLGGVLGGTGRNVLDALGGPEKIREDTERRIKCEQLDEDFPAFKVEVKDDLKWIKRSLMSAGFNPDEE